VPCGGRTRHDDRAARRRLRRADGVITDPRFHAPVTAAKFGDRLAVVNSHLDTRDFPPTSPAYEVIVVHP
jgi:hypothetical protein